MHTNKARDITGNTKNKNKKKSKLKGRWRREDIGAKWLTKRKGSQKHKTK
jgi:hypothetical protein